MVTFKPGQNTTSLELTIRDDEVFQCDRLILMTLPTSVYSTEEMIRNDSQSTTAIIVEDDDGMYVFVSPHCMYRPYCTYICMDGHTYTYTCILVEG